MIAGRDKPVPYGVCPARMRPVGATLAVARIRDEPAFGRMGETSSLTAGRDKPVPHGVCPARMRPVGATLVVARIRDVPALVDRWPPAVAVASRRTLVGLGCYR